MTSNEFWYEDPKLLDSYHIFFTNKQEEEDYSQWKLGNYIFVAIQRGVYNVLRKEGTRAQEYLGKPFMVERKEEDEIKSREEKIKERLRKSRTILQDKRK